MMPANGTKKPNHGAQAVAACHGARGGGEPPRALVSGGLFCVLISRDAWVVPVLSF